MNATTETVFIDALSLPTSERAALAERLLVSLEPAESSTEIESAWKREAVERCRAYDDGRLTDRPAADVLRDAYQKAKSNANDGRSAKKGQGAICQHI